MPVVSMVPVLAMMVSMPMMFMVLHLLDFPVEFKFGLHLKLILQLIAKDGQRKQHEGNESSLPH